MEPHVDGSTCHSHQWVGIGILDNALDYGIRGRSSSPKIVASHFADCKKVFTF